MQRRDTFSPSSTTCGAVACRSCQTLGFGRVMQPCRRHLVVRPASEPCPSSLCHFAASAARALPSTMIHRCLARSGSRTPLRGAGGLRVSQFRSLHLRVPRRVQARCCLRLRRPRFATSRAFGYRAEPNSAVKRTSNGGRRSLVAHTAVPPLNAAYLER